MLKKIINFLILSLLAITCLTSCGQLSLLHVTSTEYSHPTFAPDGRIVAQKTELYDNGTRKWLIVIMDQDGKNERVIADSKLTTHFEVSPSMNYIIGDDIIYNLKTGAKFEIKQTGFDFDWSPDEKYLVLTNGIPRTLKIYDPFTDTLVKDLGFQVSDEICWKYKEKIAFVMDDPTNYPGTRLCFVNWDGSGLVTTNINIVPESYDKTLNYVYDWRGGFTQVDLNTLECKTVYEYTHTDYQMRAISPDGKKYLLEDWNNIMQYAIYIKNIDGTGLELVKR